MRYVLALKVPVLITIFQNVQCKYKLSILSELITTIFLIIFHSTQKTLMCHPGNHQQVNTTLSKIHSVNVRIKIFITNYCMSIYVLFFEGKYSMTTILIMNRNVIDIFISKVIEILVIHLSHIIKVSIENVQNHAQCIVLNLNNLNSCLDDKNLKIFCATITLH